MEWSEIAALIGTGVGSTLAALFAKRLYNSGKEEVRNERKAEEFAALAAVYQPSAFCYTQEAIAQAIGEVHSDVRAIKAIVEQEHREKDEADREELREFRRKRDAER